MNEQKLIGKLRLTKALFAGSVAGNPVKPKRWKNRPKAKRKKKGVEAQGRGFIAMGAI